MPNRILREGINSSHRINMLSPGAELFYRRLMSVVDDFGRFYASPATVRGACWPTFPEKVCEQDVSSWIAECSQVAGILRTYEYQGCKYLEIINFGQKVRSKSRFPEPADNLLTTCPQSADTSRSRISESKTEAESDAGFSPADWADKLYARHPKKKNRPLVEGFFAELPRKWKPLAKRAGVTSMADLLLLIDRAHAAECSGLDWQKEHGSFAPKLDVWLADEGYTAHAARASPPVVPDPPSQVEIWRREKAAVEARGEEY